MHKKREGEKKEYMKTKGERRRGRESLRARTNKSIYKKYF